MRLSELARRLGAELRAETGNDPELRGVASFAHASGADLVFAESEPALDAAIRPPLSRARPTTSGLCGVWRR